MESFAVSIFYFSSLKSVPVSDLSIEAAVPIIELTYLYLFIIFPHWGQEILGDETSYTNILKSYSVFHLELIQKSFRLLLPLFYKIVFVIKQMERMQSLKIKSLAFANDNKYLFSLCNGIIADSKLKTFVGSY